MQLLKLEEGVSLVRISRNGKYCVTRRDSKTETHVYEMHVYKTRGCIVTSEVIYKIYRKVRWFGVGYWVKMGFTNSKAGVQLWAEQLGVKWTRYVGEVKWVKV